MPLFYTLVMFKSLGWKNSSDLGFYFIINTDIIYLVLDHFFIHCKRSIMDSTSSCPLLVSLYSTRGGISLYDNLSKTPLFSSSFNLITNVLLLIPLKACLNCLYLTGSVVQHNGIRISSVPLLVIIFLSLAVSDIKEDASYPSKLQLSLIIGRDFLLVSIFTPTAIVYT